MAIRHTFSEPDHAFESYWGPLCTFAWYHHRELAARVN